MAEALALGVREGVDLAALYEVITHSAGNSWMFENRGPHVLAGDYTPLSAVDIFVKDLGIVLDTARATKFPLPLSAAAHQMFLMAAAAGHGREDDAAVIKIFPGISAAGGNLDEVRPGLGRRGSAGVLADDAENPLLGLGRQLIPVLHGFDQAGAIDRPGACSQAKPEAAGHADGGA